MEDMYVLSGKIIKDFLSLFICSDIELLLEQILNCFYIKFLALMLQDVKARSENDFECIINHIVVDWIEDEDYFLDLSNRGSENAYIF